MLKCFPSLEIHSDLFFTWMLLMFIISFFSFHALLRCSVSDPFSWLTDEKRAWFHRTLLLLYLLVVHHYCFPVHIGVLEVCLANEFTFLGNNSFIGLDIPCFQIHQSFQCRCLFCVVFIKVPNSAEVKY